ncbi:MAG TPA: type II secretion system protein GspL [Gammaproteobacteria bacterium]|nr:type II secretion system protein GspL [Gammaproteobacteria bacterium]
MPETLVMLLPNENANTVHFAVFDDAGSLMQQHYHADVTLLYAQALARKVVVVVPSMAVSCLRVVLPKLSARALGRALPYALEDQLIASPEFLHYTLLPAQPNAPSDVLVVDKQVMREWLAVCDVWQVVPDVFIPSAFMLKPGFGTWAVVMKEGVDIRVNETVGFSCDAGNLNAVLKQAMQVYGAPEAFQVYSSLNEGLEITVPVQATKLSPSAMIDLYLHYPDNAAAFNLLHGEYQSRKKSVVKQAQLTQTLRFGLSVWLIFILMIPMVSWVMLTWREAGLQRDIKAIARHYSPGINSVTASRLLLQDKLKEIASGGDAALFHALAGMAKSMQTAPGIQIDRLDFHAPQFSVSVSAQSPTVFSNWMQALWSQGLQAKESNAVISGGRVHAVVIISKV